MSTPQTIETVKGIKNWKLNFFPIWIGEFISAIGSELVGFALIWYVTDTTGSAIVLTTAALVSTLPSIILSPFIGALIDRWNRKTVMIISDSVIALTTLALGLLFLYDSVAIWQIYLIMAVRSIGRSFYYPAMTSSIALLIPSSRLVKIQGLNQIAQGVLMLFSAPLGALLLEILPIHQICWIDVLTALAAILPLIMATVPQPEKKGTVSDENQALLGPVKQLFKDTREGFEFILNWKSLFTMTIMMLSINFFLTPAFSLLALLVKTHFQAGAKELGLVQSSFGIGFLLGGLLLSVWGGFKRKIVTTMLGIFIVGISTITIGFLLPSGIIGLYISNMLLGLAVPLANGPSQALRQEVIDPEMQGRYFAMSSSLASLMSPIGLALAGPLSEVFGIQSWYLVGGGVCILMSIIGRTSPFILSVENGPPAKQQTQ